MLERWCPKAGMKLTVEYKVFAGCHYPKNIAATAPLNIGLCQKCESVTVDAQKYIHTVFDFRTTLAQNEFVWCDFGTVFGAG